MGLAQLENVQWHLAQRKRVAALYEKYLPMLGDLVSTQAVPAQANHVYWMNSVILSESMKLSRDEVMAQMEAHNIEMRPLFYPMHIMPPYKDDSVHAPVAESVSSRGINLPSHGKLTEEQVRYIVESLREILEQEA